MENTIDQAKNFCRRRLESIFTDSKIIDDLIDNRHDDKYESMVAYADQFLQSSPARFVGDDWITQQIENLQKRGSKPLYIDGYVDCFKFFRDLFSSPEAIRTKRNLIMQIFSR